MSVYDHDIAWAESEILKHHKAIADLEAYRRVLLAKQGIDACSEGASVNAYTNISSDELQPSPLERAAASAVLRTKKWVILNAIASSQSGLTSQQVVMACKAQGWNDARPGNTYPQLSTFRSQGLLFQAAGLWRITADGQRYVDGNR